MNLTQDLFANANVTEPVLPFEFPKQEGFAAHYCAHKKLFVIDVPDGQLWYAPDFISPKICQRTLDYFLENDRYPIDCDWCDIGTEDLAQVNFKNIRWQQDYINMYGKRLALPRLTSWYGDAGKSYTYSGIKSEPNEWNEGLRYFKERIEALTGKAFNSVLLNWYRNGEDHLNWHSDDEPELGLNPTIASLSFGEVRDFALKHSASGSKLTIPLFPGSLLIMMGSLQHHWLHSVPKRKKVAGSRFNLTFRHIHIE